MCSKKEIDQRLELFPTRKKSATVLSEEKIIRCVTVEEIGWKYFHNYQKN